MGVALSYNLKCFIPVISDSWLILTVAENLNSGIDPGLTSINTDVLLQFLIALCFHFKFFVQHSNLPDSAPAPVSPKTTITG